MNYRFYRKVAHTVVLPYTNEYSGQSTERHIHDK